MKYKPNILQTNFYGRTPHGVRGLKSETPAATDPIMASHPARGAWIEIVNVSMKREICKVAPRTGCVD